MWEIWANRLLPSALKSCPKSNKSPNLVTLVVLLIIMNTFFISRSALSTPILSLRLLAFSQLLRI